MSREALMCEVDPDWRDYDVSLTRGWAKRIDALVPRQSRLKPVVFDLTADLRAVTITASMPNQMVSGLSAFASGYVNEKNEPTPTYRIADAMTRRLALKLQQRLNLTPDEMTEIRGACLEIQSEISKVHDATVEFTPDDVWARYMEAKGFQFGLWGTQRICFVATYNAYDNFLTRCVAIALKQPTFRRKRDDVFAKAIEDHFGAEALDLCWRCSAVAVPREVRHALSHCGGRETDKLRSLAHDFPVENGVLQVMAGHNKKLLRLIEARATYLVEIANTLPQFRKDRKPK
jgi:hypothetical protein